MSYTTHFLQGADAGKQVKVEGDFEQIKNIMEFVSQLRRRTNQQRPIALAPIRSKPERTYDPRDESWSPEGDHIPMRLASLFFRSKERWKDFVRAVQSFGDESGLFSDVSIRALGRKKEGEPFQIQVKVNGPQMNIIDVGYGVSQTIPILGEILSSPPERLFLLQQPEVHLHPRGQAALGTFLLNMHQNRKQTFVIETHSDHLVDRIFMDIRDHNADMVSKGGLSRCIRCDREVVGRMR